MEESGENWPFESDLVIGDDVIFEDGDQSESVCGDREIKEKLMALSATIGLNKMDDTTILDKAKDYVENLQERVKELEQESGSNINMCNNKRTQNVNSNEYSCGTDDNLPVVQAKVLQREVLVMIHCEKQNGVILKILTHLENLHLSVVNSSVLQFGKSNLNITIVAQMGDGYKITVDELVKTLRLVISTQ
ncbi:transcription factor NAI1-like [Trifolium pratense]|uniref:transcription factor NAI1-like n=1 Tax=Trifolium pratense TaxID=57577 RepID=UPI001E693F68|nr:transcription factor NAI1-like [Trifolium pratense]